MATKTLEVFLAVDPDGDWRAGDDAANAVDTYNEAYAAAHLRVVKLNVTLTLPEPTEVDVTVPDEAGQTVTAEVAS